MHEMMDPLLLIPIVLDFKLFPMSLRLLRGHITCVGVDRGLLLDILYNYVQIHNILIYFWFWGAYKYDIY